MVIELRALMVCKIIPVISERTNARFEIKRIIPDQISFQLSLVTITHVVLCSDVGYAIATIFPILYHSESSLPPSVIKRQSVSKELYGPDFLLLVRCTSR